MLREASRPRCLAVAVLAALLAGAAPAEKHVIGFEDFDFYPYGKPSDDEIYVGYLRAVLDAFAADRGHELEFTVIPLKRLFLAFKTGDVDMFVPDNPAWSHAYKEDIAIYYSDPVAAALDGFAVLPARKDEDVTGRVVHVGVILGFTVEPLFTDAEREKIVFDRASSFDSLFRSLFLERVDAVYCNLAVARQVLESLGKAPDSIAWSANLPRFKSLFHVSSTRQELIEDLDAWLRDHGDEVTALKREYGVLELETRPWGE